MRTLLRIFVKIGAIVATLTFAMPAFLLVGIIDFPGPLAFIQPLAIALALGLTLWLLVEVGRRVGRKPQDETEAEAVAAAARIDEADLRLVLDSKDTIGELRDLAEGLNGSAPGSQLLGLAAVADGLLNALPQVPQALDAARPLLVFYLPRVATAAAQLEANDDDAAVQRVSGAAALLGNALRASRTGSPDLRQLDKAVQALGLASGRTRVAARA